MFHFKDHVVSGNQILNKTQLVFTQLRSFVRKEEKKTLLMTYLSETTA